MINGVQEGKLNSNTDVKENTVLPDHTLICEFRLKE